MVGFSFGVSGVERVITLTSEFFLNDGIELEITKIDDTAILTTRI